jgi:hypothetical protein
MQQFRRSLTVLFILCCKTSGFLQEKPGVFSVPVLRYLFSLLRANGGNVL